jgi:hypothetical protein
MGDDWAPKLSALDGEIHTVCTGRPLGLDPFAGIARHGIHVHVYGEHFHQYFPNWTREGLVTGHLHLHPNVEPDAWVSELSRYDAAWFHLFDSANGGDLRRASWDDLNLPARIGTYAAAGLPWIMKDNRRSRVAVQALAERHGIGVFFSEFEELAVSLRDRSRLREADATPGRRGDCSPSTPTSTTWSPFSTAPSTGTANVGRTCASSAAAGLSRGACGAAVSPTVRRGARHVVTPPGFPHLGPRRPRQER